MLGEISSSKYTEALATRVAQVWVVLGLGFTEFCTPFRVDSIMIIVPALIHF